MNKKNSNSSDLPLPAFLEKIEDHGSYFTLRFKGDFGIAAIEKNRPIMDKVIKKHQLFSKHALCDLEKVTQVDTATVAGAITRLAEMNKNKKKLIFFNVPQSLKNIIDISKVGNLFSIYETEQAALSAIA